MAPAASAVEVMSSSRRESFRFRMTWIADSISSLSAYSITFHRAGTSRKKSGSDRGKDHYLHVVMLAEPGWVIPAGRYERRYAALAVSDVQRGNRSYFRALHKQIVEGGAEAMFHDLREMDLGDWHPRDIPETLLFGAALQKQQGFNLPPLEQWYVSLLHDGVLPGALVNRPNTTFTRNLLDDAIERVPRLKWDLTEVALRNFLIDEENIGIPCSKFRANSANGWSFAPLFELREAWCRRYGPIKWDTDAKEWSRKKSEQVSILDRK